MERRDLLRGGAIAATMVIAGCTEDDEDAEGEDADDTDGTGNGNGNATGDGDDAMDDDGSTDTTNDSEETDGRDDNETDDADDGTDEADEANDTDDTGGEDNESTDEGANETDETDDADDTDDDDGDGEGDGARFADTVEVEESYAFETEGGQGAEDVASTGRFDGENMYVTIDESGETVEMYTIEGQTYLVESGQCMAFPGTADDEFDEGNIDDPEAEAEAQPNVEASGREEIDGEEVYVFEIGGDEAAEYDEDVTYYVSVETGYIRRIETAESSTDFHSWGDVEPVEAPEMDCMEMGDINESDVPL